MDANHYSDAQHVIFSATASERALVRLGGRAFRALIAFCFILFTPLAWAALPDTANERAAINAVLDGGTSRWRLAGLTLPSQQDLELTFREVHLFAPNARLLRPTEDGFEHEALEPLRVFVGESATSPDGVAILIRRADGRLQGSWQDQGARYELAMEASEDRIRAFDRPPELILGNPFEDDEVRPDVDPSAIAQKYRPSGSVLPFSLAAQRNAVRELKPGQSVQLMGGVDGEPDVYRVTVPQGVKGFRVDLQGGGDADLYVVDSELSDTDTFLCAPLLAGSQESCVIRELNQSGEYLLAVHTDTQYSTVSLDFEVLANLGAGQLYGATIAIDTDYELVQTLGSVGDVQAYFASLFAYLNVTYEAEISTRLLIGDQIIPQSPSDDPYESWAGCSARLSEVQQRYAGNTSISRALLAHFSPSGGNCGVAYVPYANAGDNNFSGVLCDASYGVSVNNITGLAPNATTPISNSWDAVVTAHELGHNFSSPHSHCYGNLNGGSLSQSVDPVDACNISEPDGPGNLCAKGSASLPSNNALTGGTSGGGDGVIMSYCHLLGGGLGNISRTFGQNHQSGVLPERVAQRMSMAVENASALSGSCISIVDDSSDITLTLNAAGGGEGIVTSSPTGINCGEDCSEVFPSGTLVTLTANAGIGSVFAGWGGACSGFDASCDVTMNQSLQVTANFESESTISPLQDNVPVGPLSGDAGSNQDFSFEVLEGTGRLEVTLEVDSGDPDIFVDTTFPPVTSSPLYDDPPYPLCSSVNYPEDEICSFDDPEPGTYYIRVNGWSSFSGAVLTASTANVFTVTPSAGTGGAISPASPQPVTEGNSISFNLTPDAGYRVASVGGSCPGAYQPGELTHSAGPINGDCSVAVSFEIDPNFPLAPTVTSVTGSSSNGTIAVAFAPNTGGGVADSFAATCQPVTSSSLLQARAAPPQPHISAAMSMSLEAQHASPLFRESGLRCGSEHMSGRKVLGQQGKIVPSANQADCSLGQTVISSEYDPLSGGAYVIPVYFHVIYTSTNEGWISESRIRAQVDVLNEDFATIFNTSIRFELEGITYTQNNEWFTDSSADELAYKTALGVDQSRFLNVYTNDASGYLGYATFPADSAGGVLDGVVNLHSATGGRDNGYGNFDQGRTLVHEIGHYLGLWHTFQGNGGACANSYTSGDYIFDTPPHGSPDFGCSASSVCGGLSQIENFMNYSDDGCMDRFTEEQSNRMVCSLVNYRPSLFRIDTGGALSVTGASSPLILEGAELETQYQCSVVATNSYGASQPSNLLNVLLREVTSPPSAPVIARVETGDEEIWLQVAPSDDIEVLSYQASCSDGTTTYSATTTGSSILIAGIVNEVEYTCSVVAINALGASVETVYPDPLIPEFSPQRLPVWLLYEASKSSP